MKELRFGVVGVGSMGQHHVGSIKKTINAKLTAVCDIDEEKAKRIGDENGVKSFTSAEKMFSSGEVDAVIIATPHYDHTPLTISAFEKGLHVICEKPIAVHKADAMKMIEAHKKHKKLKFSAMFQMRTDSLNIKLKQLINSGALGEIYRVNWVITSWFRTQRYYDSGGWRATWSGEGGGVLLNQCPHNLDLFQWFFGMPIEIRAFCQLGRYHNIEVEDDVTAYCRYKNGSTGIFIASTGEAPGTNRLEICADNGRLVVENGKITFNRSEMSVKEFCYTTEKMFDIPPMWNIEIPHANEPFAHQKIIQNFTNSVLEGEKLLVEGEEGINSVELANAMLLSSIKGETVKIPMDALAFEKVLKSLIKNSKFVKKEVKVKNDDFTSSFSR